MSMTVHTVPAILVHGWKSHPGIWKRLTPRLDDVGIPYWIFDYTALDGSSMEEIAGSLGEFITAKRKEDDYARQRRYRMPLYWFLYRPLSS